MVDTVDAVRQAILKKRYMHEGETEEHEVWMRVAQSWATTPDELHDFYQMMSEKRALPNTPAIANAGRREGYQMGSACFVLPLHDSVESIMQTLKDAALVQKSGGGTGFDFSELRRENATISSTNRRTKGPVHFLNMFSDVGHYIDQGGLRDQANMGILRADHPDVLKFIHAKRDSDDDITNFNISVAATDDFMRQADTYKDQRFMRHDWPVCEVWDAIVDNAWANGDPGLIFIDRVNALRLHPELYAATNPCGEVPLLPYEACVLGSVNLAAHLIGRISCDEGERDLFEIDWQSLSDTVRTLVRMLDNIVELQDYPLPIIKETHHRYRKIGVGVMGYADMLTMMGMRYGSEEALDIAKSLMAYIQQVSYMASEELALERGQCMGWADSFAAGNALPRRNLCCQVVAPTGSIARLAGCSFGIEPHFFAEYTSNIVGESFQERHPLADHPAFVTTQDVTPEQHVLTQAAFQKYVDQAVSKTVNLPESATREDVDRIYRLAYNEGCKGITVYREKCKQASVIERMEACVDGKCSL